MLLIDGHVHIYDCFNLEEMLDSAWRNFSLQAVELDLGIDFTAIVCLAEKTEDNWFSFLAGSASRQGGSCPEIGSWKVLSTGEEESLSLVRKDGARILLLAGRQIVSSEGLEVLALMTGALFRDNISVADVLREIASQDGVPVIPWAFGKWSGHRGKVVRQLGARRETHFYFGDNGGRPAWLTLPRFVRSGRQGTHQPIFPGSDPLPLSGEEHRVGRVGFYIKKSFSSDTYAAELKRMISDGAYPVHVYGAHISLCRFVQNQCALRIQSLRKKVCVRKGR